MKVKALTNVKCESGWHDAGEIFEIHDDAFGELTGLVEKAGETVSPRIPEEVNPAEDKPKRTVRKRRE